MVTYYNKKDLVSFVHYIFSDKRRELFKNHPEFGDTNLEERLQGVHKSDIDNWMESLK